MAMTEIVAIGRSRECLCKSTDPPRSGREYVVPGLVELARAFDARALAGGRTLMNASYSL